MPNVSVEEKACGKCGVQVRLDSQFCYNCGESLETAAAEALPAPNVPHEFPKEELSDTAVKPASTARPDSSLKSAASLRRQARTAERKTVTVVWEAGENRANLPLVLSTVGFGLMTVIIVIMALYYR